MIHCCSSIKGSFLQPFHEGTVRLKLSQKKVVTMESMTPEYVRPLKERVKLITTGSLLLIPFINILLLRIFPKIKEKTI